MRRLMMPRKKLLRGSIHRVPIIPVKTRPSTIKNPQGSNLPRAMDWRAGKRQAAAQGRQGSTEQRWLCGGGHTAGGGHTLRASASHGAAPDLTALSMESQPFLGCLGRGCQAPLSQTPLLGRQRRESPHPHPRLPRRQRRRGKDACRCQPPRACSDGARQPGAPAAVRLTAHDVVGGCR